MKEHEHDNILKDFREFYIKERIFSQIQLIILEFQISIDL